MTTFTDNKKAIGILYEDSLKPHINKSELFDRFKIICEKYDKLWEKVGVFKGNFWEKSVVRRALQVHERIRLVNKLEIDAENSNDTFTKYMYFPLCSYLMLTCFDQLGQPGDWKFFPDWILSKSKKNERLQAISEIEIKDKVEFSRQLYLKYQNIYGVRNSFFRFLNKIIPSDQKVVLLNQIQIYYYENYPKNLTNRETGSNLDKEKWLYKVRNDYTHNTLASGPFHKVFDSYSNKEWIQREMNHNKKLTTEILTTNNFEKELKETVIQGLLSFIKIESKC